MVHSLLGIMLLALGISMLLGFDLFHFLVPLLFIALGLWLFTKKNPSEIKTTPEKKESIETKENPSNADTIDEVYVFSGTRKVLTTSTLTQGRLVTVFGGADLDMREVKTKEKTLTFELVAVMGGIRLHVPQNWNVMSDGMNAVLGGFDNRATTDSEKAIKVLVRGASVLGGIEIYY